MSDGKLDHKEGWASKKWCFQVVVPNKTPGSPLDSKKLKPVNPKGNQAWIFIRRTGCWSSSTLASWSKGLTHWKGPWCWERLRAGGEGGSIVWDGWMASPTQGAWVWTNSEWEIVKDRKVWHAAIRGVTKSWTWLSDGTQYMLNIPTSLL